MSKNEETINMIINVQYAKDLSLEVPLAPEIFKKLTTAPKLNMDFGIATNQLQDNNYEVVLNMKIKSSIEEDTLFILELDYGCVCTLNLPEEIKEMALYIEIPKLLFPYARQIITTSLANAGLPPLMLAPVDFAAVYNAKKKQEKAN